MAIRNSSYLLNTVTFRTIRNMNWGECKTCMDYCRLVNVSIRMKIHQKGPLTRITISQRPGAFVLAIYETLPGF